MQMIPVYIVSLKNATDRRALMQEHLQSQKIDHEFIDAIRGDALDPAYRKEINPDGNMSPGAIGCYLSHIQIYDRIIKDNTPVALILEDDTVLHHSVKPLLDDGCQNLDFDYCFLGSDDNGNEGYVFYDAGKPVTLTRQHKTYLLSSGPYCSNAYLITIEGAKRRASCAFPARAAVDHYDCLPYNPRFMAILPMIAFVNDQSAVNSMSSVSWSGLQTSARKYWWYYPLRDIVKLKFLKKLLALQKAKFPHPGQWRPIESAFKVVARKRYVRKDAALIES